MEEILRIENLGKEANPLSPLERIRLERRVEELEKEVEIYKAKIENAQIVLA